MEIEETINELIEKGEEYITDYIDGYICGYIQGYLKKMLTKEMIERRLNLAEEMIQKSGGQPVFPFLRLLEEDGIRDFPQFLREAPGGGIDVEADSQHHVVQLPGFQVK